MSSLLRALPPGTVRLLGSGQVVTSVSGAVKELVENAVDAGATSVDVRLDDWGLRRVEVRDNGSGVPAEDGPFFGKRHFTSKMSTFADLRAISGYGFRGEALASLCAVSEVTVTTRSQDESVGRQYVLDNQGEITRSKPSPLPQGTAVCVVNLFKNLPVRKQFNSTAKRKKEELKKVENLVAAYGLICPGLRLILRHNGDVLWQKAGVPDLRSAALSVLGSSVFHQLVHHQQSSEEPKISFEVFLPQKDSDPQLVSRRTADQCFVFVNKRPVRMKELLKVVQRYYSKGSICDVTRYPIFLLSLTIPPCDVDVNVNPNKTLVTLSHQDTVLKMVTQILINVYGPLDSEMLVKEQDAVVVPSDSLLVQKVTASTSEMGELDSDTDLSCRDGLVKHPAVGSSRNSLYLPLENSGEEIQSKRADSFHGTDGRLLSEEKGKGTSGCFGTTDEIQMAADGQCAAEEGESREGSSNCSIFSQCYGDFTLEENFLTQSGSTLLKDNKPNLDSRRDGEFGNRPVAESDDDLHAERAPELWSRGDIIESSTGQPLEPVKLFAPLTSPRSRKRPSSPSSNTGLPESSVKKKCLSSELGQMTLYDLVGSQPIKRPVTSFIFFSKEVRPQVVAENPNASFKELADMIGRMWRNLTEDEKKKYEESCHKDVERYKAQIQAAKEMKKKSNGKSIATKTKTTIREKLMDADKFSSSSKTVPLDPLKMMDVTFSLRDLKSKLARPPVSQTKLNGTPVPIGPLKSRGIWVCHQGDQLLLLNPHRVNETVIYHRLMEIYHVPAVHLEQPLVLNERLVGGRRLWATLLSMDCIHSLPDPFLRVKDPRIIDNGLEINIYEGNQSLDTETRVEIVALTDLIPTFGIGDLCELLEIIASTGAETLYQCRPLKILHYLKSEAVRMARQAPSFTSLDDVRELLQKSLQLRQTCVHGKPFFHKVYELSDLPESQQSVLEHGHLNTW